MKLYAKVTKSMHSSLCLSAVFAHFPQYTRTGYFPESSSCRPHNKVQVFPDFPV